MKFNLYSFHKGIADHRFDHNNTIALINALTEKGYEINHLEYSGSDEFVYHGVTINQGSILIFEDAEHGTFKTYDFGDHPSLTVALSKSRKFVGAVIGQYNPAYWDSLITEQAIRDNIVGGPYPDSVWQLGINYDAVQEARATMTLDKRLYWRGSLYASGVEPRYLGVRKALELLPNNLSESELHFGQGPLSFELYLQEAFQFQLALSIGGGGGALCGDLCFRDIEMFGLGIPLMRPKLIVENSEPLIPDFHYVAVDAEFDPEYRYANPEELSKRIATRYREVIEDTEFLEFVKNNAKKWYENNISYPKITYNIIKLLNL
jgi:hypothetical protein